MKLTLSSDIYFILILQLCSKAHGPMSIKANTMAPGVSRRKINIGQPTGKETRKFNLKSSFLLRWCGRYYRKGEGNLLIDCMSKRESLEFFCVSVNVLYKMYVSLDVESYHVL